MAGAPAQPGAPRQAGGSRRVLIAGGGTGGHLFPGMAIADALRAQDPTTTVRFAGSAHGLEHTAIPARGDHLYRIRVRGLYGIRGPRRWLALALLPLAFLQSLWVLLRFRPHLVLGVGGYASGPVLLMALLARPLLRCRCAIQEQNAAPGMTNRLLGRWVQRSYLANHDSAGHFRHPVVLGNPVRQPILALRGEEGAPAPSPTPSPAPSPEPVTLLVFGGSQGARVLNTAMCEALPRLAAAPFPLRIIHQTGRADHATVREAYVAQAGGLAWEAHPFIDDMAGAYTTAHLVLARAGASTVSELIAARKAAVLVPIPGSSGNHQLRNAEGLANAGCAVLLPQAELSGERLATELLALLADHARLAQMAAATDALFNGDSAARIAADALQWMG